MRAVGTHPPTWGIITARGGSKRIPNKNMVPLNGQPLIWYSIQAAQQSTGLSGCLVTSDDKDILDFAEKHGAVSLERPPHLASDSASSLDVLVHAIQALLDNGTSIERFCLLQPTSPLRTAADIDEALRRLDESGRSCLVSVTAAHPHPYKTVVETPGGLQPVRSWDDLSAPYQSLPRALQQNGAIYAMDARQFLKERSLWIEPVFYEMPKERSIDVDEPVDIRIIETILQEKV